MTHLKILALICLVASPLLAMAVEEAEHQYTSKEIIIFPPEAMVAFDRSGKFVTSRTLADGSTITEFNGSMVNVTVARLGPDGKVETYCTSNAEAARSWMAGEFDTKPETTQIVPIRVK